MATNCYSIVFKSPRIRSSTDTETNKRLYAAFSRYFHKLLRINRMLRLFLNYTGGFGKIYFKTKEEIDILQRAIKKDNSMSIEFGEIKFDPITKKAKKAAKWFDNKKKSDLSDVNSKIKNINISVNPKKKPATEVSPKLQEYPSGNLCLEQSLPDKHFLLEVVKKISETSFIGFAVTDAAMELLYRLKSADLNLQATEGRVLDMVIVKLEGGLHLSRAIILEHKDKMYKVALLEYGKTVELDEVFAVPPELQNFDEFICMCHAPAAFVKTLSKTPIEVKQSEPNQLKVRRSNITILCARWVPENHVQSDGVEESEESDEREEPPPSPLPPTPMKIYSVLDLPRPQLQLNEPFKLLVASVATDGSMFFCPYQCGEVLRNILRDLGNMQEQLKPLEPVLVGQLCLALYAGDWSRAMALVVKGDDAIVSFLDFGIGCKVPLKTIKAMPDEFLQFAPSALKGMLVEDSLFKDLGMDLLYGTYMAIAKFAVRDVYHLQLTERVETMTTMM